MRTVESPLKYRISLDEALILKDKVAALKSRTFGKPWLLGFGCSIVLLNAFVPLPKTAAN